MDELKLRIYCPDHRVLSQVLRSRTLLCESGRHTLSSDFPNENFWRYCCDCGSFSPFGNGGGGVALKRDEESHERCQVCERRAEYWYLCDRCKVFTTQSAPEVRGKPFSLCLRGHGGPDPMCPGCLSKPVAGIREHICDTLLNLGVEVILMTPGASCPLCGEDIDAADGWPKNAGHRPEKTHLLAGGASRPPDMPRPATERSDFHQEAQMWLAVKQWVGQHWKGLLGSAALALLIGLLTSLCWDAIKEARRARPLVTKISAEAYEVPQGRQVKVWAETFPSDIRPGRYDWAPEDRIINNGQQLILLNTDTDKRRTESYEIKVSLTPVDSQGFPLPQPSPIFIKVVPPAQWNNKPRIIMPIRTNPKSQEIRAGDSITLEALATDKDEDNGDRLYYDWYVENEAAQVEKNGEPRVKINTPSDLARHSSVPLRIRLTVKDGHEGGFDIDNATFMVVPKPRPRPRKGTAGPPKYIVIQQPSAQPQGANANAGVVPAPAPALPQPPPAKQPAPPAGSPPANAQPPKSQQTKEGAQDGSP